MMLEFLQLIMLIIIASMLHSGVQHIIELLEELNSD